MTAAVLPEALAAHVAAAAGRAGAARALLLDVDGTLAPIVPRPQDARIPDGVLDALDRLRRDGWRAALVSGRPAAEVVRLAEGRGLPVFGSHGFETPGGEAALLPAMRERLAAIAEAIERAAEGWTGVFVESKPAGFAVHDRGLDPDRLGAWRAVLRRALAREDRTGLEVLSGRRLVEVRLEGVHKGRVVGLWAPARQARPDDASVVAAGDDRTDEDLFRAVGPGATTVRVGGRGSATAARWRLPSPVAVGKFLDALVRLTSESAA